MAGMTFDLATHSGYYVSVAKLAAYLDVDRRTITRMIEQGSLPAVKVGRAYRIPAAVARSVFHVEQKQAS